MSHRDWDLTCKVYIGNLGNNASKHEIESTFTKYGPLKNIWVARNPPGFAFVEYEDPRDAEDAVRGLDGTRMSGNRIRVEMSSGRTRQRSGPSYRGGGGRYGGSGGDRGDRGDRGNYGSSRGYRVFGYLVLDHQSVAVVLPVARHITTNDLVRETQLTDVNVHDASFHGDIGFVIYNVRNLLAYYTIILT